MRNVLICDISVAQELLGREGLIDRIDLAFDDAQAEQELRGWLPPGLTLQASETRLNTMTQMTRAFHTNLTAMSLLALLVAGFLIYNAMMFAVLRRREQFGALRSLGISHRELFTMVIGEALILGTIATAFGLALGVALGNVLVELVTVTINDLYYRVHVNELFVSKVSLLKGVALGILVTCIAAWLPALNAARSAPVSLQQRSSIEGSASRLFPALFALGLLMLFAGWWLAGIPGRSIVLGFTALAMVVIGFSLAVPLMVKWFCAIPGLIAAKRGTPLARMGCARHLSGIKSHWPGSSRLNHRGSYYAWGRNNDRQLSHYPFRLAGADSQ